MEFEHLSLIAEITTEESAKYSVIAVICTATTWIAFNLVKPWFTDWLEDRKTYRAARIKREDAVAQAQIDEIKRAKEEDDRIFERMVQQGKDDTAHMNLLSAVVDLIREIRRDIRDINGTQQDIYNKLRIDRDDRYKPVQPTQTDGQQTPGRTV